LNLYCLFLGLEDEEKRLKTSAKCLFNKLSKRAGML